jgi:lysophospholipase L1-like esterase
MRASTRVRRTLATIAAAAMLITGTVSGASAANAAAVAPTGIVKMAALGDSITLAVNSCSSWSGCAQYSWSTGTNTGVPSHFQKIRAVNPALIGYNDAVSGAKSIGLNAQAVKAVSQQAQYVTIEMGANDACTRTTAEMTSVDAFRVNVKQALATLNPAGTVTPRQVFVASIPNLRTMFDINRGSSSARLTWGLLRICQSMLANPTSNLPADEARRAMVLQRVVDFNLVLAQECGAYPGVCRFDNNAVFNTAFTKAHISTRDYFHPSLAGQVLLANTTWTASQWGS